MKKMRAGVRRVKPSPGTTATSNKPTRKTQSDSLRDEMAQAAMTGLLACYSKITNQCFPYDGEIARRAYDIADAMLYARSQEDVQG